MGTALQVLRLRWLRRLTFSHGSCLQLMGGPHSWNWRLCFWWAVAARAVTFAAGLHVRQGPQ
eukprot:SAG11_NODE_24515_length_372_cov_0.805861_1_plen_61_part_01